MSINYVLVSLFEDKNGGYDNAKFYKWWLYKYEREFKSYI